jgi:pyruvyl transferase EpsO
MQAAVEALRAIIRRVLDPLIPIGSDCVLIDFPHHANVGDSAIWLGEISYLQSRRCKLRYICDSQNYNQDALRAVLGESIVLLHGGGNFGDIYPNHQELKEKVIRSFPAHRIIQLPQSIHFAGGDNLVRAKLILAQHKDFHFVTRDTASHRLAQDHFQCKLYLCPDSALMLDLKPLASRQKSVNVVVLSRTDDEKASHIASVPNNAISSHVVDWLDEATPKYQWLYDWCHRRLGWGKSKVPPFALNLLALLAANHMAQQRLDRGLAILGQGDIVITDRLHGIILAWMGGTTVYYTDNSYKKLSNFLSTWLEDTENIIHCTSFKEAFNFAEVKIESLRADKTSRSV